MKILQVKDLCKKYMRKSSYALDNFSLVVDKGEMIALIGESGSGKTTLLRLIAGFEEPQKGQIVINDRLVVDDKTFIPPEKRQVGMVFQDYALFPHLSVTENIKFGLSKWNNKTKKERVAEMLSIVGLLGYETRYPYQLSGGQQQRVALARALAPKPNLLLLDEPFSNLDSMLKEQVREDIRNIIKKTGTTAIFVTHDTKDALATADRIVIMKEGKIQQTGAPEDVYNNPVNTYVANFFGKVNILDANVVSEGFSTCIGLIPSPSFKGSNQNEKVKLMIRPDSFLPSVNSPCFKGTIKSVNYLGEQKLLNVHVETAGQPQNLLIKVDNQIHFEHGVEFSFKIEINKIHIINE